MNLRQLKTLCEVIDRKLKIADAADALYRSESSVSRQIQDLEKELGLQILRRRKNRILDVTDEGRQVAVIARRIVNDVENLGRLSKDLSRMGEGSFTIATTHTQALHTLPRVISRFKKAYPAVALTILHGPPGQCYRLVSEHGADLAVCTERRELSDGMVEIPCYRLNRSVITPPRHPLLRMKKLTLEAIARYPLLSYDERQKGHWIVNKAFADQGLRPNMVFSTMDIDVGKKYVELGMGVAIAATVTFDAKIDRHLRCLDASHLFPPTTLNVVFRHDAYMRAYMIDFIGMFAPHMRKADITGAMTGHPQLTARRIPEI